MTTHTTAAPRKAEITSHMRQDLRDTYLAVADAGVADIATIEDKVRANTRYARELLGVLEHANLIVKPDEAGQEWEINADHYKDRAYNEIETADLIDEWLTEKLGPVTSTKASPPTRTATTPPKTRVPSKASPSGTCLCGCGRATRKSFAPGHDARFAGMVAKELASKTIADPTGMSSEQVGSILSILPSQPLRDKAWKQAQSLIGKASNKQATPKSDTVSAHFAGMEAAKQEIEPDYTYGVVKIGKNRFAARRDNDGVIMRHNKALPNTVIPLATYAELDYTGSVEGNPAKSFKTLEVQP